MDLISCTLGLAHMFQQNSVGSLRLRWLWLEMYVGLLRLLLSSTVFVSLHLWKVCTKQTNKQIRQQGGVVPVWGTRDTPKAPGHDFQDPSYSSPLMNKEMAPHCQITHPSTLEAALHHEQQSVFPQCFLLVSGGWLWAEQCLYFRPAGTVLSTALGRISHFSQKTSS